MVLVLNNIINFLFKKNIKIFRDTTILCTLYYLFEKLFNFSGFIKINKLCFNDSLMALYLLSSPTNTICFLIVLIFLLTYIWHKYLINTCFILFIGFLFYFIKCNFLDSYVMNTLAVQSINTNLQNGLLNIHPIFVYFTYAVVLVFWINRYLQANINSSSRDSITKIFSIFGVIVTGTYLGSFWASQELNWGGFWSWDPVEIISLFLCCHCLFILHNYSKKFLNNPVSHLIITVIVIYFIIRLGVINTIHSFVRNNNNPYVVNIFLMSIFLVCLNNLIHYYSVYKFVKLKRHIVFWVLVMWYLYLYVLMLLEHWSSFLTNPAVWYFVVSMLLLYTIIIYTLCGNFTNTRLHAVCLLLFLLLYVKNFSFFIILLCVTVCYLNFIKNLKLHILFLFLYIIFFIFFVNISCYSINVLTNLCLNYNVNNVTHSTVINQLYESFFFLKKTAIHIKVKNTLIHVSGFSITSNFFSNFFIFSKNNNINHVFTIEVVFIILPYLILLYFINLPSHKYFYKIRTY